MPNNVFHIGRELLIEVYIKDILDGHLMIGLLIDIQVCVVTCDLLASFGNFTIVWNTLTYKLSLVFMLQSLRPYEHILL